MKKSIFYTILSLIIIAGLAIIASSFYYFREDFDEDTYTVADNVEIGHYEDNPAEDSIAFDSQRQRLEAEWTRIEQQCDRSERDARHYQQMYNDYY